mgnify:CR=1 FL=1
MVSNDNCNEFRKSVDEFGIAALSASLGQHINDCVACARWQEENQSIVMMVDAMPQFDVSEQLTQRILTSLPRQSPSMISSTFLIPAAVVGAAALGAVMPFESIEGLASSAVSLLALFMIHLLIKSARTEEMVA